MMDITKGRVRAITDVSDGAVMATVDIAASPERVFQALASNEVCGWWVRPGVFDTREWTADVRVGGRWRATGISRGQPYVLEGEFLLVDPPRKLVHTWQSAAAGSAASTVTYVLEPMEGGTRLTLWHNGLALETRENTCIGWETSFERLAEMLASSAK